MKKLNELQLEQVSGGDKVTAFCGGFTAGSTVYALGAYAMLWNPIGWGGGIAIGVVTLGCVLY